MSEEPKKETVRITLPPRPSNGAPGGVVKHETVRITTQIPPPGSASISPASAPAPRPLAPPPAGLGSVAAGAPPRPLGVPGGLPPRPLGTSGAGLPPKPLGGGLPPRPAAPLAPKPPGSLAPASPLAPKPPGALAPAAPVAPKPPGNLAPASPLAPKPFTPGASAAPSAPKAVGEAAPVILKPSPKKETARIQIPNDPKPLPQATVKIQQTQPLTQAPAAIVKSTGAIKHAPPAPGDSLLTPLSFVIFLVSLAVFAIQLLTFL